MNAFLAELLEDSEPAPEAAPVQTLAQTAAPPAECPRLGSFARPVICRGDRLTGCPWHTCGGELERAGDYYQCRKCSTWFELKPADFGVYVGDLVGDLASDAAEWMT